MHPILKSALCLVASLLPVSGTVHGAESNEALAVAQQVHDIFEAKCASCHGPELPRPKGKFGYVLDLRRVAGNPDYVVRGKPADSELYRLVFHDEMPGEDADVPPLTPPEKDLVKRWIEIGAPGELPGVKEQPALASQEPARPPEALFKRLFRWIGRFHPLSTHFPIALMFVAVFAETLAWYTRRESWLGTVRFLIVLAALSGVGATTLGWVDAYFSSYNKATGALLWWHRWLGTGTCAWAIICASLIFIGDQGEGSIARRRFRGALMLGAALVAVSGFLGSALIYGLDHYAWR